MVRWQAELLGHEFDLADLPRVFPGGAVRVRAEGGHLYLEGSELDSQDNHGAVRDAAESLVTRINGVMRLRDPGYQNVRLGPVHEIGPDGSRRTTQVVAVETAIGREKAMPVTAVGGIPLAASPDPAIRRLDIASRDADAREVLELWANGEHSWVNLYKIHEIVQSRGGQSLEAVTKAELRRFDHTANHEKAAGPNARHARSKTQPPKNPMSLAEADELIRRLVEAWLDSISEE